MSLEESFQEPEASSTEDDEGSYDYAYPDYESYDTTGEQYQDYGGFDTEMNTNSNDTNDSNETESSNGFSENW